MLGAQIFAIVMSSSCIDPLIIMQCSSLSLVVFFIVKSVLSDMKIGTSAFFCFQNLFFHSLSFSLYMSLDPKHLFQFFGLDAYSHELNVCPCFERSSIQSLHLLCKNVSWDSLYEIASVARFECVKKPYICVLMTCASIPEITIMFLTYLLKYFQV